MGVLKGIGYFLATILVLSVLVGGGLLVTALVAVGGVFFFALGVFVLVVFLIKEYFTNATRHKDPR